MDTEPTAARGDAVQSRPWTPAAAMEPVPPLAPPPARPGAGTAIVITPRPPDPGARLRTLLSLAAVALIVTALVMIVIVFGH